MLNKIKNTFSTMLILSFLALPAGARVLMDLSSSDQANRQVSSPEVYRPTKLMVGTPTKFVIKAAPNSNVALQITTDEQRQELMTRIDGNTGEKGITELVLELPEEKELINTIVYFDVFVWQNEDLSDVQRARIIGIDGSSTSSDAIAIMAKPCSSKLPGFGTTMPGVGDVSRTMEAIHSDIDYSNEVYYQNNKPLMLRNLRAPELEEQDGK